MQKKILNLGVLAHVDAGKTSLTEQMLLASGQLRVAGSVDKGTSITDSLNIERERGISVRSASATFNWKQTKINIIDTPGHVDFCAEVERSLPALDAAVLVISAVEGVQGHTIAIFNALRELKIPTLIFINKIDRLGASLEAVLLDIEFELTSQIVVLQAAVNQGEDNAAINCIWNEDVYQQAIDGASFDDVGFDGVCLSERLNKIIESVIEQSDDLLNQYLDGAQLSYTSINDYLIEGTRNCELVPVIAGSAKNSVGIYQLMDTIVEYFPVPNSSITTGISAIVFKIEFDESLGKLVHLRVFNGTILPKDLVNNSRLGVDEKVNQLRQVVNGKFISVKQLFAGDIGIVSGFTLAKIGDLYGLSSEFHDSVSLSTPLLTVQVKPEDNKDYSALVLAMKQLSKEDPLLNLNWLSEIQELHLNITGKIQVEVLQSLLKERFNLETAFTLPTIIYKETPSSVGFGFERYWMPKPCWAILKLKIEPAERGSGVKYQSQLGLNSIASKYQNEIEQTIEQALNQGVKGWQVTDVVITLVDGEDHNIHTRPGDYIVATPMAVMNGLVETGTTLLEPILSFTIVASNDLLGAITSDITKMRGEFVSPEMSEHKFTLRGKLPAATSIEYPIELASLSSGKAKISTKLFGYEACDLSLGKETPFKGISPLDRDKWILSARGAIK